MIITDDYVTKQTKATSGIKLNKLEAKAWGWFGTAYGYLVAAKSLNQRYCWGLAVGMMTAANNLTMNWLYEKGLWFKVGFTPEGDPVFTPMYHSHALSFVQIGMMGESFIFVITGFKR